MSCTDAFTWTETGRESGARCLPAQTLLLGQAPLSSILERWQVQAAGVQKETRGSQEAAQPPVGLTPLVASESLLFCPNHPLQEVPPPPTHPRV